MFDSFSDIQEARREVGFAKSIVSKNETMAVYEAARACYISKRANYRLFVFLTSSVVEDSNQTLNSIPMYIAKPPDAVATLAKSVKVYESANVSEVFQGYPASPEIAWQYVVRMEASARQLWWDDNSAANLARLSKQQVTSYLAEQKPIYHRQIESEFGSLRLRGIIQVAIPLIFCAVASAPTVLILRRRLAGWVSHLGKLNWSGYLFQRRIMGPLLFGSGVSLGVAAGSLFLILSDLRDKSQYYGIGMESGSVDFAGQMTIVAVFSSAMLSIIVILNGASTKARLATGITSLCFLLLGLFALISAWLIILASLGSLAIP